MARRRSRTARDAALAEIGYSLHRLARRYAVGQSSSAADALLYDACVSILAGAAGDSAGWQARLSPTATHDRFVRRGAEEIRETFALPVTCDDAVVVLHRYARRYANGRGTFTAPVVNDAARELLRLGVDLSPTEAIEGTVWAADGAEGMYDGLEPALRELALRSARPAAGARDAG